MATHIDRPTFRTDDINLASFIKINNGKLVDIGSSTDSFKVRCYFEFEDPEMCNALKLAYLNDAQGSIKAFIDAKDLFIKEVKSRIKGFQ